jgi:hypothetical protein
MNSDPTSGLLEISCLFIAHQYFTKSVILLFSDGTSADSHCEMGTCCPPMSSTSGQVFKGCIPLCLHTSPVNIIPPHTAMTEYFILSKFYSQDDPAFALVDDEKYPNQVVCYAEGPPGNKGHVRNFIKSLH